MKNIFFVIAIFYAINLNSQTDLNYYFGNTNNFNESMNFLHVSIPPSNSKPTRAP